MKLYLKLYIAFCITLLLATAIMISLLYHLNELNEKAQWESFLSDRVNSLSELVLNNLVNDGLDKDKKKAAKLSSERIGRWLGGKLWILDSSQSILGSNTDDSIPSLDGYHFIQIQNSQFTKDDHSWIAKVDLGKNGIKVVIAIPKPDRQGPHLFLGIVFSILLGFIILFLPLNNLIGKPLNEIKNTAFEISQGNLNRRASVHSKDELEKVADTINLMANQIQRVLQNSKDVNAHVSHELRSPIARMKVILELLTDESKEYNPSSLKRRQELAQEIERIDELVGAVLQLSKFHIQEGIYKNSNVSYILEKVLNDRSDYITENRIHVKTHIDQTIIAELDPIWSESIFKNLIDNSLLYGNLRKEIKIELRIKQNTILFTIENSLKEEISDPEKWFLPFVRGQDETSSLNKNGLGLGLALSRSSAERMGGSLEAVQSLGKILFIWAHPLR